MNHYTDHFIEHSHYIIMDFSIESIKSHDTFITPHKNIVNFVTAPMHQ